MTKKLRVLIADDHTIVRIGLRSVLEYEPDIEVIAEATNGEEAVRETLKHRPDIVIMDLVMPKLDGVAATREIRQKLPGSKVMILTTFGASDGIAHALEAGASGAMMKTADDGKIVTAIRKIASGDTCISPEVRKQLSENPPAPPLSPRQEEVLVLIADGKTNKEIASQIGIRLDSVEAIANALFVKLGAANRAEAVAIALRKHLLKIQ